MNTIVLDLQIACKNRKNIPKKYQFQMWLNVIFSQIKQKSKLTVRLVDEEESYKLNLTFAKQAKPTNVLSFPFGTLKNIKIPLLGDLIICKPVVEKEAKQQKKSLEAHWAHMVIHGSLHLLGFNHVKNDDAEKMELLETKIMFLLGYRDPYIFNIG